MNTRRLNLLTVLAATMALAACGPEDASNTSAAAPAAQPAKAQTVVPRGELGTVTAVVPLRTQEPTTGAGAVIGGVLGAAVGNQVGGGDGRKAATVIGAVGGAAIGNNVEKQRNTHVTGYRVDVRLDNGGTTSMTLGDPQGLASGQRVRVVDGTLRPA